MIQRRILAFFLIAYALTWFGTLGNLVLPSKAWPVPMNPLGPIIAAPLVILLTEGWSGFVVWLRRIARLRAPPWVYAAAFFIPLAIILASIGLAIAVGTPAGPLPSYGPLEFLMFFPLALFDGPAPEELAFRGFGQHELQESMSPLVARLLIGLGVLVWHLPVLLLGYIPWPIAIALLAVSVVYAWLYQVGGSVWPLVTLHFVQNYFGAGYFGSVFAKSDGAVWTGYLTAFYTSSGPSLSPGGSGRRWDERRSSLGQSLARPLEGPG